MGYLNILCVDDDRDILEIVRLALRLDPKISVQTASGSDEALQLLLSAAEPIDGILLDVKMPGAGGQLLLGEIRGLPGHAGTPVIFLTADIRARERDECMALGAAAVLSKPFDTLTLARDVRRVLEQRSRTGKQSITRRR